MDTRRILIFATYFFGFCGIAMIGCSYFYIEIHIAVPNIGLGAMGVAVGASWLTRLRINHNKHDIIAYLSVLIIFLCYVVSVLINNDGDKAAILRYRSYIIGCAVCFFFLPVLNRNFYKYVIFTVLLNLVILSLVCVKNYYFVALREGFQSKFLIIEYFYYYIIPFHVWHHTLCFFLLVGIIFMLYLLGNKRYSLSKFERVFSWVSIIVLTLTMHIIGSRTALGVLYVIALYFFFKSYFNLKGLMIGIGIICILSVFYFQLGFLKNKVDNTTKDIAHLFDKKLSNSDYRLYSYKISFEIISKNFWKGISISRSSGYYENIIKKQYPDIPLLRPHNDFLNNAVLMGVPIAIIILLAMYTPFIVFIDNKLIMVFYMSLLLYLILDSPMNIREFYYFYCFVVPFLIHLKKLDSEPNSFELQP